MDDHEADNFEMITEAQLAQQRVGAVKVKDGELFTFTTEVLAALLERSRKAGRVVVLVKRGAES